MSDAAGFLIKVDSLFMIPIFLGTAGRLLCQRQFYLPSPAFHSEPKESSSPSASCVI